MPPNLPQCGHFSSNKPDGCNGPSPSSLLGASAVGVEAPECYSRGLRRGVSTVPRSLWVAVQTTSLHRCCLRCSIWAYLTLILFFCQAENFVDGLKISSVFCHIIHKRSFVRAADTKCPAFASSSREWRGGNKIPALRPPNIVGCSDFADAPLPVFFTRQ